MDARSRRRIEMGANAAEFSRRHPNESPGYQAVLSGLDGMLAQAKVALATQRTNLLAVHANAVAKLELEATMRQSHLAHISQVAKRAGSEVREVPHEFVFKPGTDSHVGFQTTAWGFLTQAEARRDLLVRHGLVESVLDELRQSLDEFDAAMVGGAEARAAHVRASAELRRLANEVVQVVRVLDRFNRVRFRDLPDALAEWRSVSNVAESRGKKEPEDGEGSGGAPEDGGEARPAA